MVDLFNGVGDPNDMVATEPTDGTTSISTTGNSDMIISFAGHAGAVPADSIIFNMADGSTQTINYCGGCASNTDAAIDLHAQLTGNAVIAEEFNITLAGTSVTIDGPAAGDFADFSGISVTLGDIVIDTASDRWYVPYASTSSLNVYFGGNASLDMTNFVASTQAVAGAGSVNQEVASAIDSNDQVVIATKNSSGNLSVYRIDSSFVLVDNVSNVFNFTGSEEIFGLSVSTGGGDDDVWVACKNYNSSTGFNLLSVAILDGNGIATYASTTSFNDTNYAAQPGLDEVKIIGHPTTDGTAIIAFTTDSTHQEDVGSSPGDGIPNEAHLFKVFMSDTITFAGEPQLASYNSSTTNLTSPKLNTNNTVDQGAIAVTPIFNFTVGHIDESSTPAVEDSVETSLFFSFHENNGGTALVHGMYNIDSENMSTDAELEGSYPSYVEN
jgi:hypothetical protein